MRSNCSLGRPLLPCRGNDKSPPPSFERIVNRRSYNSEPSSFDDMCVLLDDGIVDMFEAICKILRELVADFKVSERQVYF